MAPRSKPCAAQSPFKMRWSSAIRVCPRTVKSYAAELDQRPVAGALEHPAVLAGDRGVDEFGAQRSEPRERTVFTGACHPTEADHVRGKNSRDFSSFGHSAPLLRTNLAQRLGYNCSGSKTSRFKGNSAPLAERPQWVGTGSPAPSLTCRRAVQGSLPCNQSNLSAEVLPAILLRPQQPAGDARLFEEGERPGA